MPSGGQEPGNMIDCYETGLALEKILKTKINLNELPASSEQIEPEKWIEELKTMGEQL